MFNLLVPVRCLIIFILNYDWVDCIMDAYRNQTKFDDPQFRNRMRTFCWNYGFNGDDFIEISHKDLDRQIKTIYLRKEFVSESRSVDYYMQEYKEKSNLVGFMVVTLYLLWNHVGLKLIYFYLFYFNIELLYFT